MPKGSFLHLRWAAANIDPQEWAEAKSLKLDRKAGTRHLTFFSGSTGFVPGAHLFSSGAKRWHGIVLLDRVGSFKYAAGQYILTSNRALCWGTLALNLKLRRRFEACDFTRQHLRRIAARAVFQPVPSKDINISV